MRKRMRKSDQAALDFVVNVYCQWLKGQKSKTCQFLCLSHLRQVRVAVRGWAVFKRDCPERCQMPLCHSRSTYEFYTGTK
jgi:hypothetical protein